MIAPIPSAQLDSRIKGFLARKDQEHPEIHLLEGKNSHPSEDSAERDGSVWFRSSGVLKY